jgi:ubiquinone/menaquinone biosynthesis C-methylase UbiE
MNRFDDQAKEWDDNPDMFLRAKKFANEIMTIIGTNKNKKALEFGCGTGVLSFELKDTFQNIILVDTSKGMIDVLKLKIEAQGINNFKPLCIDLLQNTNNINNIDVIYTLMTLHHISDLDRAFTVFNDIINTHGYLCIADLVEEDGTFHDPELNFEGHCGFNKEALTEKLDEYGFKVIYYSVPYTIEKQSNSENLLKKYPLFLMIAKKATNPC